MTDNKTAAIAPRPAKKPLERTHHGDTVIDNYDWLRDKENPEVIKHLNAENAYADRLLTPLAPLRDQIVEEIKSHTQETDSSVPFRDGDYWYIARTREGDNYPRLSRIAVADAPTQPKVDTESDDLLPGETVYLDAQALSDGHEFFQLGGLTINDRSNRLAYSVDTTGGEVFDLRIVDLNTGTIIDDTVKDVAYGLDFSADGSHIFYARNDDAWRQCEIWVHQVGADANTDRLVFREDDEKFTAGAESSRDGSSLLIFTGSRTTSEVLILPLDDPHATPQSIAGRVPGVEYSVEHAGDHFLVIHNRDHVGFALARQELDARGSAAQDTWHEVLAPKAGERIEDVDAFATHAAITMRANGLPTVRVLPRSTQLSHQPGPNAYASLESRVRGNAPAPGELHGQSSGKGAILDRLPEGQCGWDRTATWDISHGGELDAVYMSHNRDWEQESIWYTLESMLTPTTIAEVAPSGGKPRVLKVTHVPNFDPNNYVEKRLWATATDGTKVPISLVARADATPDSTNPGFLYGYGSYEIPSDPGLVVSWLSLLDRGVVVAVAHVRGGGEMGREWYDDGKMLHKKNTFMDFVDCAHFLIDEGWFDRERIAAEGGSAGGLLMGAITNLAPDTFRVVHARVPFVDTLTTILDPSLPLTVGEWEEWGNPLEDPEVYQYMKEYTPYENIAKVQYPAVLATTSLNDIRVFFVEPAKWVARLREETLNYAGGEEVPARPIAFKCEMVAGHGGRSGRYAKWEQRAEEFAFILDQIGATELL